MGRIKTVLQSEHSECGLAVASCIMHYFGKKIPLSKLRSDYGSPKGGLSFSNICNILRSEKIEYKGVRVNNASDLPNSRFPSVLLWDNTHFVVLYKQILGKYYVMDPRIGRVSYPAKELANHFSGLALVFESFETAKTIESSPNNGVSEILRNSLKLMLSTKLAIAGLIGTSFAIKTLTLAVPLSSQYLIDGGFYEFSSRSTLLILIVLFSSYYIALASNRLLLAHLQLKWSKGLSLDFMERALNKRLAFFINRSSGSMIYKSSLMNSIQQTLSGSTLQNIVDFIFLFVYLGFMISLSLNLTAWLLVICSLVFICSFIYSKWNYSINNTSLELQSDLQQLSVEIFSGIETIKALGLESEFYKKWRDRLLKSLTSIKKQGVVSAWVSNISGSMIYIIPLSVLFLGLDLSRNGLMTTGQVVAFMTLSTYFADPFSKLISSLSQLMLIKSYLNQISDIFYEEDYSTLDFSKSASDSEMIGLHHVNYKYSYFDELVLDDVTLSIARGEKIAVVGRSGSGKSTLLKIISGLLEPVTGNVSRSSIARLESDSNNRICYIPQNPAIFNDTLMENILLGQKPPDNQSLFEVLRSSEVLKITERCKGGLNAIISEAGMNISGGQRQKISIARSMIRQPDLLVMDEPTSSLDVISERSILDYVFDNSNTLVIAAHRLSTVRNADRIIVMDGGHIIEQGSHEQLMKKRNLYWELYSKQNVGCGA